MSPEQSIAHYRIRPLLGEGGMGAVYRATDTKLNRDVAIKMLPDPDRMSRFRREAQVLASLNHLNIAAIYRIELGAIVMELVEGEDLHGPVPVAAAIDYARQSAAGLEAAHEKGIVYGDLKPANIKVTPDGVVKLLDFGLAKAGEPGGPSSADSPTVTIGGTLAGWILGTAGYLAPEQALGKAVDRRADIWAFGVFAGAALVAVSWGQSPPAEARPTSRLPDESAGIDRIVRTLISAFDQFDIVALGEAHGLFRLDSDLRTALVRHPDFAKKVRSIVVEFPSTSEQSTLDRYIRGEVARRRLSQIGEELA